MERRVRVGTGGGRGNSVVILDTTEKEGSDNNRDKTGWYRWARPAVQRSDGTITGRC